MAGTSDRIGWIGLGGDPREAKGSLEDALPGRGVHEEVLPKALGHGKALGLQHTGTIAEGQQADLVVMDAAFRVKQTWVAGRLMS